MSSRGQGDSKFWRAYARHRYAVLFYALLATLIVGPIAATVGIPTILIKPMLGLCLLAAVMPNGTKRSRRVLFALTLAIIVAKEAADESMLRASSGWVLILVGVIGILTAAASLRFAITSKTVDGETVSAALSTYLLAGLFFGQIYWSIETMRPGSIIGPDPTTELTSIYYSFVTIAAIGYGDFLPRTDIPRGLAPFEVIGGQLYLAVLVARLIGSFSGGTKANE